jgi:predicted nucleotidyltransferase
LDLVRLENELKDVLGKEVDLLTYDSLHPKIKKYAQQDEVRLYK